MINHPNLVGPIPWNAMALLPNIRRIIFQATPRLAGQQLPEITGSLANLIEFLPPEGSIGPIPDSWSLMKNMTRLYETHLLFLPLQRSWKFVQILYHRLDISVIWPHFDSICIPCGLNGTIPSSLSAWTDIQEIGLGGNQLEGTIPFDFSKMKILYVIVRSHRIQTANSLSVSGNSSKMQFRVLTI